MAPETEILVHITAPSTSTDDAHYRSLARAYQSFECRTRIGLTSPDLTAQSRRISLSSEFISPQASFQSVWDNVKPAHPVQHSEQSVANTSPGGRQSQESWVAPPSEVEDSMPDNDITLEGFTTPTRVLNYIIQTTRPLSESTQETSRRDASTVFEGSDDLTTTVVAQEHDIPALGGRSAVDQVAEASEGEQASESRHSSHEVPLEMSSALSNSEDMFQISESLFALPDPAEPALPLPPTSAVGEPRLDPAQHLRSRLEIGQPTAHRPIASVQPPERADSEPPPSKKSRPSPLDENTCQGLGRSTSDMLPAGLVKPTSQSRAWPDNAAVPGPGGTQPPDWSDMTEIVSAEPAPGCHKLAPQPPLLLEDFVRKTGMAGRYRPRFQARELRPFERGYWLLKMNGWPHDARVEAWGFLGNFIRRDGMAGWGARACRDECWAWIRLYGWEHIARELYWLLYWASYRRMKQMDVVWYDGAGKELIIVGARSDKGIRG